MKHHSIPPEFDLESYRYELPEERIAQTPAQKRDTSRLLIVNRQNGQIQETVFHELGAYLPKDALLVANNTSVIPARLFGHKKSGGKIEFLLLTPLPLLEAQTGENGLSTARARGLLRASKAPKIGDVLDFGAQLKIEVRDRHDFGQYDVQLVWQGNLNELFASQGEMPLPPYIRRPQGQQDAVRYQTTFCRAEKNGSVAAPTAGLHFTPQLRETLQKQGFSWAEVTLYVGYGTFSPIRVRDIRQHSMHAEYVEIDQQCADAVAAAKTQGRPIVAIGTTSARALEGLYGKGQKIRATSGWTDIFIKPGYQFGIVDHLLTNFHLPASSLLVLVSTLAGKEQIKTAYSYALEKNFSFFSYGDAMLIV